MTIVNKALKSAVLALTALSLSGVSTTSDADIRVVASIKPVHSLVAAVMGDTGTPKVLIEGASSPHSYALRPSQVQSLQDANVVFWIGPPLESFMSKAIRTAGANAASVALIDTKGLTRLPFREGHDHEHGHDEHDKHDEQDYAKHDEHDHGKHKKHDEHDHAKHDEHEHDKHDEHGADEIDPHVWLDPENAKVMVDAIAAVLAAADPGAAETYKSNAARTKTQLDDLRQEVAKTLHHVEDARFIVFHDAYQYFEVRFGMKSAGSIALNPETNPGAERLREVKKQIAEMGATCVFSEPQFKPKLVNLVIEGTSAKTAELDPLGAAVPAGPDHYITTIRTMANSMRDCLS